MHNLKVSDSSGMPSLNPAVIPSPEPTREALLAALADRDRELAEARERQTATAEILRVISESPTDAKPVFESIVLTAARLLDCTRAFVLLCDGGAFSVAAAGSPQGVLAPRGGKTPIDPSANFPSRAIPAKEEL
jgi:two-component system, NtrC family, sensor kinase